MKPKQVYALPVGRHATESRDCTVRALALAANIPYDTAHAELAAAGRKPGKGMYEKDYIPVYERHGFVRQHITRSPYFYTIHDGEGGSRRACKWVSELTVNQFVQQNPKGRFILQVRGHVIPVIDGVCHDTGRFTPRCQVNAVYKKAS